MGALDKAAIDAVKRILRVRCDKCGAGWMGWCVRPDGMLADTLHAARLRKASTEATR